MLTGKVQQQKEQHHSSSSQRLIKIDAVFIRVNLSQNSVRLHLGYSK